MEPDHYEPGTGTFDAVLELLLPRTDAGVGVQAILVVVVGLGLIWVTRHDDTWRIFTIGAFVLALGLLGVRALH